MFVLKFWLIDGLQKKGGNEIKRLQPTVNRGIQFPSLESNKD